MTLTDVARADSGFPADFRLVLALARTQPDETVGEELRALPGEVNWQEVLALARRHWVLPLVYRSLTAVLPSALTPELNRALQTSVHRTAILNLSYAHELKGIQDLLQRHDLRTIAFKGPLLAQMAYRNLGLRPCSDLDILVSRDRYPDVERALRSAGFSTAGHIRELSGRRKGTYLFLSRQAAFVRDNVHLDVHLSLMPPGYRLRHGFDALYERSVLIRVGQMDLRTFSPEDLLLLLCFHGVKNRWELLKYYTDVAELIRSHPEMDWGAAVARARETRAERNLRLGLHLVERLLQAPLPPEVSAWSRQDPRVLALAEELIRALSSSPMRHLTPRERFRFHLSVQDSISTRAQYLVYALARRINAGWMPENE